MKNEDEMEAFLNCLDKWANGLLFACCAAYLLTLGAVYLYVNEWCWHFWQDLCLFGGAGCLLWFGLGYVICSVFPKADKYIWFFAGPLVILLLIPLFPLAGPMWFEHKKGIVIDKLWAMYRENISLKKRIKSMEARLQ